MSDDTTKSETSATTDNAPIAKKRGCLSCGVMIGGLVFLLFLVSWIFLFHSVPLKISKETTFVTEPLRKDGKRIDYFLAFEKKIYPPEMQTDENGARMWVEAIGVPNEGMKNPEFDRQFREKLGIDPWAKPKMSFIGPSAYLNHLEKTSPEALASLKLEQWIASDTITTSYPDDENKSKIEAIEAKRAAVDSDEYRNFKIDIREIEKKLYVPWTLSEYPMMENWLKENSPALDLIAEAVKKPVLIGSPQRKQGIRYAE